MPGIYSDFKADHARGAKYVFHGFVEKSVLTGLWLNLGVAYDTAFGEERFYPTGGVIWQADEKLTMRFVLPSPSIYWAQSDNLGLFLSAAPAGDFWKLYDKDDEKLAFETESWRASGGVEHRLSGNFWIRATGGMDFNRKYKFTRDGETTLKSDADDAWLASMALDMY